MNDSFHVNPKFPFFSQLSLYNALFHPENAYEYVRFFSMSPTRFHQLGTIKETRRDLHSKTLHFNLEEHYVVRQTSSSMHLTISSSQINGKQKQISLHQTFIYIVSQVTAKIFFRFTIKAGLTNRPKAQPFSLSLCTHFISNYFVPTFEDQKNIRDWMDLRSQYQRKKTKPRYSIENLRRKKLLANVMKNYQPFVGYLQYLDCSIKTLYNV
jgi:hypothetical protein